jgi:hypothetical protein
MFHAGQKLAAAVFEKYEAWRRFPAVDITGIRGWKLEKLKTRSYDETSNSLI